MTTSIGIIGGGIVGSTAAFYLSQQDDIKITLFDEGVGQATSAAAGIISPWLSQRRNKEWYFLAKEGASFYHTFINDLSKYIDTKEIYQQQGTLLYKKTDKLLQKLEKLAQTRKEEAPEIGDISLLNQQEINQLIPNISDTNHALFVSGGARVDGAKLVESIRSIIKKNQQYKHEFIQSIAYDNMSKNWIVAYDSHQEVFDYLILATGAWLPNLLTPLGFKVDVRPQKGQLIELQTNLDTSNWPVIMPVGESDIIPFEHGKIVIGATHEDDLGYDLTPDLSQLLHLKQVASETISTFSQEIINRERIGTRAYTSDYSPFFGEITNLPNLYVASGLGSSGLTTGPIIGKTISDWILKTETKFEDYRHKPDHYVTVNS